MVVGRFHPQYDGTNNPVMLDYPDWTGHYSDGSSEYVLRNDTGGVPNDALADVLRSKFKCNFTWYRSGTSIDKVVFSNSNSDIDADFKFENYSYSVSNSSGLIKGGNLQTVLDEFVAKFTDLGNYSANFSNIVTTVLMMLTGSVVTTSVSIVSDKKLPNDNKTDKKPELDDDSSEEPMMASALLPENDNEW